ncbi:hypothetical protein GC194_10995 [bacterium]|nr:hypothetical protein [bacterium]
MKIVISILQVLLALHTAMGAFWKLSNSEQSVDSLKALPHALWQSLPVLELAFVVMLIAPLFKSNWHKMAAIAAFGVATEMLLYSVVHLASGFPFNGELVYWLVVMIISALIGIGKLRVK